MTLKAIVYETHAAERHVIVTVSHSTNEANRSLHSGASHSSVKYILV